MSDFGELAELDVALYRAILVKPNRGVAEFVDTLSGAGHGPGPSRDARDARGATDATPSTRPGSPRSPPAAPPAPPEDAEAAGEPAGPSVDDLEKAVARLAAMGLV